MSIFRVQDILKEKVLVSRESARLLEGPLAALMASPVSDAGASSSTPLTVDFQGVGGVAPSFMDELLAIFESLVALEENENRRFLIVANPPTRLSRKFEAVARGHGMSARALDDGSWLLARDKHTAE